MADSIIGHRLDSISVPLPSQGLGSSKLQTLVTGWTFLVTSPDPGAF